MPIRIKFNYIPSTQADSRAYAYPEFQTSANTLTHGYFRRDQKSGYHSARSIILADVPLTEDERVALQALLHLVGQQGFSNAGKALHSALSTAFLAGIEYSKKAPPT